MGIRAKSEVKAFRKIGIGAIHFQVVIDQLWLFTEILFLAFIWWLFCHLALDETKNMVRVYKNLGSYFNRVFYEY